MNFSASSVVWCSCGGSALYKRATVRRGSFRGKFLGILTVMTEAFQDGVRREVSAGRAKRSLRNQRSTQELCLLTYNMFICVCVWMYVSVYHSLCLFINLSISSFAYLSLYSSIYSNIYLSIYLHLYIYLYMTSYSFVYTTVSVRVCGCVCLRLCMCV